MNCRRVLAASEVAPEMRSLAENLLDHVLEMHEARRLRIPVFLLALDTLELVPGLEECVAEMRATAGRELAGGPGAPGAAR